MQRDSDLSLAPLDAPSAARATPSQPSAPRGRTCPRCHYTRQPTDTPPPAWQCPRCVVAYDKALQRRRVDDDEEDAPVRPCSQRRAEPQRPWALIALGGSPYRNAIGSPPDPAEARQWLERAASQGDPVAAVRLGGLYERGEQTARQPSLAENWYLRAARQGHAAGLYSLGMLYARGAAPVSQRPVPAWMQLTLADRPSSARAGLIRLKERMPPSDIAEAERLADAWKPGLPLGL